MRSAVPRQGSSWRHLAKVLHVCGCVGQQRSSEVSIPSHGDWRLERQGNLGRHYILWTLLVWNPQGHFTCEKVHKHRYPTINSCSNLVMVLTSLPYVYKGFIGGKVYVVSGDTSSTSWGTDPTVALGTSLPSLQSLIKIQYPQEFRSHTCPPFQHSY